MEPVSKNLGSQPSWLIENDQIELSISKSGGHMAPVYFYKKSKNPIQPYYINPWHDENIKISVPVLGPLRGDFFCMPFGANDKPYREEEHPAHGETASAQWDFVSLNKEDTVTCLELKMDTHIRPGTVRKKVHCVDGQNVLYIRHELEGYSGKMCLGHHATLSGTYPEDSLKISHAPIQFGMVEPEENTIYQDGEYYSLLKGARFKSLEKVPTIWKNPAFTDASLFPRRKGFVDILILIAKQNQSKKKKPRPYWTAVTISDEGYLWFTLKDPQVLPSTLLWMENHGRHGSPWFGRNCCIGLEDICAFFGKGILPSTKKNLLEKEGVKTSLSLSKRKPLDINYIEGVCKIPKNFRKVAKVKFSKSKLTFISDKGKEVSAKVFHDFIFNGKVS